MESAVLLSVVPVGERALTLTVSVGGEARSYTVGRSVWERLGERAVGDEITDAEIDSLARASEARRAYGLAVRILENGEVNGRGLLLRLSRKGVSREAAAFALSRMRELGYIREREQAERYAALMSRRSLWGRRRIEAELIARGYTEADVEAGIEAAVESGAIDFEKTRAVLLRRLTARGYAGEKLAAAMYRYGY